MRHFGLVIVATVFLAGCSENKKPREEAAPKKSIIGQTTNDIKKFDPNSGQEVQSSEYKNESGPLLYALDGYKSAVQKISEDIIVTHAIQLFQAENGRYPKDYQEFMEKIIKANNVQLPMLPMSLEYQYDEKNHKLVVVTKAKKSDDASKKQK